MDSRFNKSCTENNGTKVFELIITNPCSEPSKPVDISCVVKDLTVMRNTLDTVSGKDGLTDSEPIVIDDLDNEEVTSTDEKSPKDNTQKSNEAHIKISNNNKMSAAKITFDCNDNQKESTESVIILDETKTCDPSKLTSGQLSKNVVENDNLTTDSYLDLYETELQSALDANKTDSRTKVRDKPPQNAVDINIGKPSELEKALRSVNITKKDDQTIAIDVDFYETESQNVVSLNGNREDSDVIVLDKTNCENIIQDDNENRVLAKEYPPIDLVAEEDLLSEIMISEDYADEFKENSLLSELVQKCLNMERNGGMSRVINRTLLNIYKSVDEKYKKSVALRKVLTRTIMKLHMEPELKFSHIKCLCDHLKLHMVKKRVPFVTLEKRSTGDQSWLTNNYTVPNKKRRMETIDLDNYAVENQTASPSKPKEYPPIEINDSSSSLEEVSDIIIVDKEKAKKKKIKKKKKKKQKGRLASAFIPTLVRNPFCTIPDPSLKEIPTYNESERLPVKSTCPLSTQIIPTQISSLQTKSTSAQIVDSILEEPQVNCQPLLTPVVMEPVPLNPGHSDLDDEAWKKSEIQGMENHIAFLREEIEKLDVMEVEADDERSPYIISEHYQAMLVKQYKKLCELTGTQEKKQHKVRLQVLPGHPEAPVRYLQEFLNDNIDDEGNPPFPDLYDVIQCVSKANIECHMNWGQAQVMKEARSLFIQFGQTMQKRRQKREWKDLMNRVKEEVIDPADEDPELMMKLNRNSWLAKQKENALLDRYASLEETGLSRRMANELSVRMENGGPEPETESSDDENANPQVSYSSIPTYEGQNNVASSVSITNGNIATPAAYDSTISQKIVGSTITLSNGLIEIAPTYDMHNTFIVLPNGMNTTTPFQVNSNNTFGVTSTQNATNNFVVNDIQNVTSTENRVSKSNDFSIYSLAFQNFTSKLAAASNAGKCNLCTVVQSNVCFHNTNVCIDNVGTVNGTSAVNNRNADTVNIDVSTANNGIVSAVNRNVGTVNGSVSAVNNSNVTTVNNSIESTDNGDKVDLEAATNLAKTIMELVQKDISLKTNNGNKNTKEIDSSNDSMKSTDVIVKEETDEKIYESVCDIFTHKTKVTNKTTTNENTEVKETPNCIETKTNENNVPNQANVETSSEIETEAVSIEDALKLEPLDIETKTDEINVPMVETSSEIETKDVSTGDIVKPEPPDIPRMLAELGEEYTAEIFDIEDPFLVIEISDSSESEDEVT